MATSLQSYTRQRMVKATPLRTLDATFARASGALSTLKQRGLSLIAGRSDPGWAVGVGGAAAREVSSAPDQVLGLLGTNEVVYACMRERMKVLITPQFVVERKQADGSYIVEDDHPLTALFRRPGENLDTATFWRCLEASYGSLGRLYLEPIRTSRRGDLTGLNPINPVYMVERYDGMGRLEGYDWQPPGGAIVRFGVDDLITRRAVDWADPPPLLAALQAVDSDELASEFISGFFAGGGIPSAIIRRDDTPTPEWADSFRTRWMEVFRPGSRLPAILDEHTLSYERVGVSLNELDNETLRMFIETRICMCFGVPPLIIYAYAGLLKATYSNLQEAWSSFWDATALPLLREWADWITWSLLTFYEDADDVRAGNVRCRFDYANVGPYQEDVTAKVEMYRQGYDLGAVTMNELRGVMGMAAHPDGDVFKAPPAPPIPYQLPPTDPESADEIAAAAGVPPTGKAIVVREQKAPLPTTPRLDDDVAAYLRAQYAEARRLWLLGSDAGAASVLASIGDKLDTGLGLFAILAPAERRVYAAGWKDAARHIEQDVILDTGDLTAAVDQLAHRAVGITETTRREIEDVILTGAREGQSDADIARALGKLSIDRAAARAPAITRTELALASTTASTAAYRASGVVAKVQWLAGPDPCEECQERDGQEYDMAGTLPDMPAHPNCVCAWAPVLSPVEVPA